MKGTAIAALQVECGEMPLELRRRNLSLKFAAKVSAIDNHPASDVLQDNCQFRKARPEKKAFMKIGNLHIQEVVHDLEKIKTGSTPPWQTETPVVNTDLHRIIQKSEDSEQAMKVLAQEHISAQDQQAIQIYTDGSKMEEKVGGAYYDQNNNQSSSFRITDNNTIYTAELIAIEEALKYIELSEHSLFIIYSNSLSAVESIEVGTSQSRPNLMDRILKKHAEVKAKEKQVEIHWIPSHIGIRGNDRADELAKESLQHQEVDIIIKREIKDRYKEIDDITRNLWQTRWDNETTGRHCYSIQPQVGKAAKYTNRDCRKKEVIISRLRLGRCRLHAYLHEMDIHTDGLCNTCDIPETINHFLMSCQQQTSLRIKLENVCRAINEPFELRTLLSNNQCIREIYAFIHENEDIMKNRI